MTQHMALHLHGSWSALQFWSLYMPAKSRWTNHCLAFKFTVKSQAGRLGASAVTVHSTPRWHSAPQMTAQGSIKWSFASSEAEGCGGPPGTGGLVDSLLSQRKLLSLSTKVPLWLVRRLSTCSSVSKLSVVSLPAGWEQAKQQSHHLLAKDV